MNTLLLYCQDPYFPGRPPWYAFAAFDQAVGKKLDVVFQLPSGWIRALIDTRDCGGAVIAYGHAARIDTWEDTFNNFLRLCVFMNTYQAATVAEGLSRLAPLLEALGTGEEVTECLIKNL